MKNIQRLAIVCMLTIPFALPVSAQDHATHASPYAGFEDREIKSLAPSDIEELLNGGGWGLALPAELNGVPGPAHLLELKAELELTGEQVDAIEEIYAEMKLEAIAAGKRLIAAEQAIEAAFRGGFMTQETLRGLIHEASMAREDLRFVHLSRHLETPPLLTEAQITRYNILRGYADDPCASTPEGHDPVMWRKHNNCD